jgi:hypothetical protein
MMQTPRSWAFSRNLAQANVWGKGKLEVLPLLRLRSLEHHPAAQDGHIDACGLDALGRDAQEILIQ